MLHSFETSSVWLGGVSVWLDWVRVQCVPERGECVARLGGGSVCCWEWFQCLAGREWGLLKEKKYSDVKNVHVRIFERSCSNET